MKHASARPLPDTNDLRPPSPHDDKGRDPTALAASEASAKSDASEATNANTVDDAAEDQDPSAPASKDERTPTLVLGPPPTPREALSPFLDHRDDGQLPDALIEDDRRPGVVVDLLRDPAAVGRRILSPEELPHLVLAAALLVLVCGAFFAVVTLAPWASSDEIWRSSVMTPMSLLITLATALGPVWGVSVVMAARLPLARLAACMLASVATAGLLLVAASPLPYAAWKADDAWGGPLALLLTFGLACLLGGQRLKALLMFTAAESARRKHGDEEARLSDEDAFRVGVLARMAMVALAFAGSLAVWAFQPFG